MNNWLFRFGHKYKYFIVFDADSKADPDFINHMVCYAEHPGNNDVAVFQSKTLTWNRSSRFVRALGAGNKVRISVMERVSNSLDSLLSFGHNNLHRTNVLLATNGFDEDISAEDTSISLKISEYGYYCKLVNVVSYDAEPENISIYLRRSGRWFRQTMELFKKPWTGARFSLKLTVCRSLIFYLLQIVYPLLLILTMLHSDISIQQIMTYVEMLLVNSQYSTLLFWMLPLMMISVNLIMSAVIAFREKVRASDYLLFIMLSISISYCMVPVLIKASLLQLFRQKIVFNPTNEVTSARLQVWNFTETLRISWFSSVIILLALLTSFFNPCGFLINANIIWITTAFFSPFILYHFHKPTES